MSIHITWEVQCDFPTCSETLILEGGTTYEGGGVKSIANARRVASEEGWGDWSGGAKGNFCPQHRALYSKDVWGRVQGGGPQADEEDLTSS